MEKSHLHSEKFARGHFGCFCLVSIILPDFVTMESIEDSIIWHLRRRRKRLRRKLCITCLSYAFLGTLNSRSSPRFRVYINCDTFDIVTQRKLFRFSFEEIDYLCSLLKLSDPFVSSRRHKLSSRRALSILLCRLSGTRSELDVAILFGVSQSYVSCICNELADVFATSVRQTSL